MDSSFLLLILIILPAIANSYECDFRQEADSGANTVEDNDRSGAFTTNLYHWAGHIVFYMFEDSVSDEDREVIEDTMEIIEDKTCLRFKETKYRRRKTLVIRTEGSYPYCAACLYFGILCPSKNGGTVRTDPWCTRDFYCPYVFQGATNMVLQFNLPFCGRITPKFEGLILHELFHALGMIHTQARPDRNEYIKVNVDAIEHSQLSQYLPVCHNCHTFGLPYECDSVMHYGYKDFAAIGRLLAWFQPTMSPVDDTCSLTPDGGSEPTTIDWRMVNRAQRCPDVP